MYYEYLVQTSFSFAMQADQVAEQRMKCVLNDVCVSNKRLVVEFGEHGKDVGLMLGYNKLLTI